LTEKYPLVLTATVKAGNVTDVSTKAEFNIWFDPTEAKKVFDKSNVYMVGLNAHMQLA